MKKLMYLGKKKMPNPLKMDPTRTTTMRRRFVADITARFKSVTRDIWKLVVDDDAFNLNPAKPLVIMAAKEFAFQTSEQKVQSFNRWFQGKIDEKILTVDHTGKPWTGKYVDSAYKKGAIRAYTDTHKKSLMTSQDFYEGSKAQFLKSSFAKPIRISKMRLLGTRVFEELKGITTTMSSKMNVILAEGIAHGKGPRVIAREMAKTITGLTNKRAKVLARTEIIYAHAEGQLDSFEDLGVREIRAMAEWSTAGDDRVCSECEALDGEVMTIEEARGMIPLHPNCRCAWIPANVGETRKGREKKRLERALRRTA
jgi:SPP1 gp7 family putative phage head morphogenesis protein